MQSAPQVVRRLVELDVAPDVVWELVGTAAGWQRWLVDDAGELLVAPGEVGEVVDGGRHLLVRVDRVIEGERVEVTWSSSDDGGAESRVVIAVEPGRAGGSTIRITEETPSADAATIERWESRVVALWLGCHVALVRR